MGGGAGTGRSIPITGSFCLYSSEPVLQNIFHIHDTESVPQGQFSKDTTAGNPLSGEGSVIDFLHAAAGAP